MASMSPPATTASHLKTLIGNPVDTGRKLNVHKTFSLRPVSTGNVFPSFSSHKITYDNITATISGHLLQYLIVTNILPNSSYQNPAFMKDIGQNEKKKVL